MVLPTLPAPMMVTFLVITFILLFGFELLC